MATVKFPEEMDLASAIAGDDKLMIAKATTGESMQATFDSAKQYLNITGIEMKPVPAGALPAGPSGQTRTMEILSAGTWTWSGNSFVNPTGAILKLWWDGTNWSKGDGVALPQAQADGVVAKDNVKATSGDAVYSYLSPVMNAGTILPFKLMKGYIDASGVYDSSVNWICAVVEMISPSTQYSIRGYGVSSGSSAPVLASTRINHFNGNTYLGKTASTGSGDFAFNSMAGANRLIINIEAASGVGNNPETSPFNQTFKIYTGTELKTPTIKGPTIEGVIQTEQIKSLEESAKTSSVAALSGNGSPLTALGADGAQYIDYSAGLIYRKLTGKWGNGIPLGGQKRKKEYPTEFPWKPFDIFKLSSNGVYVPDVTDLSMKVIDQVVAMVPYYVDPVHGSDSNDGKSRDKAFATCNKAINAGASLVYLMDGIYDRDHALDRQLVTKNMAFIADSGAKPIMTSWDNATKYTWTADENVHYTTRSALFNVIDTNKYLSEKEGYFMYSKVDSLALCKATSFTFYVNGSIVYINNGGTAPGANIKLCLQQYVFEFVLSANIDFVYVEGIISYVQSPRGGFAFLNNATTQYNGKYYVKNCRSYGNRQGNAFSYDNVKEVWNQNCFGSKCLRDAHNYHTSISGYEKFKAVEINASAYNTGWEAPAETSSNGTTAHDGGTIIRFIGQFDLSRGSTVVDVNPGTRSLLYNVEASGAYLSDKACFHIQDGKMWLFGAYAHSGTQAARADGTLEPPTLYYDSESLLLGDKFGNVVPYTG